MNIIIIDQDSSSRVNGIGTYIQALIDIAQKNKATIYRIAYSSECKSFKKEEQNGVKTFCFPPLPYLNIPLVVDKFLGLYLNDSEKNLFIFNYSPCELFIQTIKKRFPFSKLVFTIHDMTWTYELYGDTEKFKNIITTALERSKTEIPTDLLNYFHEEQRMFNLVDHVIVLANETQELLVSQYKIPLHKISLIPNGLGDSYQLVSNEEKQRIRKNLHLELKEKIILFTGRIHYIKGIYSLIKSFKKVLEHYPDCRLVLVGFVFDFPKTSSLSKMIASKVIFTGQLAKDELNDWYKIADIGVLPSYVEQCSYTGIEMMMHSLPIIASDGFCVKDMFKDGVNAKVAKIENREDPSLFESNLAHAIIELLKTDDLREQLREDARKSYESTYQIEHMQRGYENLLDKLFHQTN